MNWHALVTDYQQEGSFWKRKPFIPLILLSLGSPWPSFPDLFPSCLLLKIIFISLPLKWYIQWLWNTLLFHLLFHIRKPFLKVIKLVQSAKARRLIKLLVAPGCQCRGSAGPSAVLWLQDTWRQSPDWGSLHVCILVARARPGLDAAAAQKLGSSTLLFCV